MLGVGTGVPEVTRLRWLSMLDASDDRWSIAPASAAWSIFTDMLLLPPPPLSVSTASPPP